MSAALWPTDVSCSLANRCQLLIGHVMSADHLPTNIKEQGSSGISDLVDFLSCFLSNSNRFLLPYNGNNDKDIK